MTIKRIGGYAHFTVESRWPMQGVFRDKYALVCRMMPEIDQHTEAVAKEFNQWFRTGPSNEVVHAFANDGLLQDQGRKIVAAATGKFGGWDRYEFELDLRLPKEDEPRVDGLRSDAIKIGGYLPFDLVTYSADPRCDRLADRAGARLANTLEAGKFPCTPAQVERFRDRLRGVGDPEDRDAAMAALLGYEAQAIQETLAHADLRRNPGIACHVEVRGHEREMERERKVELSAQQPGPTRSRGARR